MVKLRSAYYCNLKLLLIFLVILGHWIEPLIGTDPRLYRLYRFLYLFHMPLFAFLSGLFVRSCGDCVRQLRRVLPLYVLCQLRGTGLCFTNLDDILTARQFLRAPETESWEAAAAIGVERGKVHFASLSHRELPDWLPKLENALYPSAHPDY